MCRPGLDRKGRGPSPAHHSRSLHSVHRLAHLSVAMLATLDAHLHLVDRKASHQHRTVLERAFSSAAFVALLIQGRYSSSGRRRGPTIFLSIARCVARRAFFSETDNFHDSEHQSTLLETVASNKRRRCLSHASFLSNKRCRSRVWPSRRSVSP